MREHLIKREGRRGQGRAGEGRENEEGCTISCRSASNLFVSLFPLLSPLSRTVLSVH